MFHNSVSRFIFNLQRRKISIAQKAFLQHIQHIPQMCGIKIRKPLTGGTSPACKDANFYSHQSHAESQLPHAHKPHPTPCSPEPKIPPFTQLKPHMWHSFMTEDCIDMLDSSSVWHSKEHLQSVWCCILWCNFTNLYLIYYTVLKFRNILWKLQSLVWFIKQVLSDHFYPEVELIW
jgi:hypothetical protein